MTESAPAPRYGYVVFDADGTLFDFAQSERLALAATLAAHGVPFDDEIHGEYRRISHRLWTALEQGTISSQRLRVQRFEELAAALGVNLDAERLSREYIERLGGQSILLPGARALVERLAARCVLALATNGIADVQRRRFAASGLERTFRAVVISDEIGIAKPEPGYFEVVFEALGDPPRDEVLMVGDSLSSDIAGGHRSGIDTCWFNPAGLPHGEDIVPTYEVRTLDEVAVIALGA